MAIVGEARIARKAPGAVVKACVGVVSDVRVRAHMRVRVLPGIPLAVHAGTPGGRVDPGAPTGVFTPLAWLGRPAPTQAPVSGDGRAAGVPGWSQKRRAAVTGAAT